jgi:YfiH family protein
MTSDHWQWHTGQGLPYLRCELLQPWDHGFFTCQFAPQVPQELATVLTDEPVTVHRVRQVHGRQVLPSTPETQVEPYPDADGLVSWAAQQSIWVCSADCTPALIGDLRTGRVAAVHAGWRGTAARILPEAIQQMQALGSRLEDLRIALGPAIAGSVYQVDAGVAVQVGHSLYPGKFPEDLLELLHNLPYPPLLHDATPGKVRLDVRRINELQLEALDLQPEQISVAPHCTFQEPDQFFSYRRTGKKSVQWSGIVSRSGSA